MACVPIPSGNRDARAFVIALVCILMSGCMAEFVEKKPPRKGPVAEVGYIERGGGDVRYSIEGWGLVVSARRSAAMRKIRRLCKHLQPKIVDEFTREDADAPYSGAELSEGMARGLEHYKVAPYRHIIFDCVEEKKPQ
jgi:hypothetical protein